MVGRRMCGKEENSKKGIEEMEENGLGEKGRRN